MIFKKLILFFVLSSVSFYIKYYYEKQKRPGTGYLEHQVAKCNQKNYLLSDPSPGQF